MVCEEVARSETTLVELWVFCWCSQEAGNLTPTTHDRKFTAAAASPSSFLVPGIRRRGCCVRLSCNIIALLNTEIHDARSHVLAAIRGFRHLQRIMSIAIERASTITLMLAREKGGGTLN